MRVNPRATLVGEAALANGRFHCHDTFGSPFMAAISFPNPRSRAIRTFIARLGHSRFFTISVALHFVFVLTFGSVVLVRNAATPTEVMDSAGDLVQSASAPPAPDAVQPIEQSQQDVTPQPVNNQPATAFTPLTFSGTNGVFDLPVDAPTDAMSAKPPPIIDSNRQNNATAPTALQPGAIPPKIAAGIKSFTGDWSPGDQKGSGVSHDRKFKFTAFLAKYAGGDWDSTVKLTNGKITRGSLPNLLYIIRKLSNDKIEADPDAVPLDIASDELFAKKPPFILLTGHRDFVLTPREVENLSKYLQLGGCVWGDSSLPGNRSRFDIAFRREMKRVLPDQDIQWQALPMTHDLFNKKYWKEVVGVPPGMNYYQEPVYALKNFGEVVVIYTANDYCDMWQIALDEKLEYDLRRDEGNALAVTNETVFRKRDIYFRDLGLPELRTSYKFGTNIILHLLTRWEDKLRNVPSGL